jgi:hypothetical protein
MAGNPSARKNVTRERKQAEEKATQEKRKKSFAKGGEPGKKKLSPEDQAMRKKKISNKEAEDILKKQSKARKIKREQKAATERNRPGVNAKNKFLI